jgi:glucose-1-phosphate thymidylyltransferase
VKALVLAAGYATRLRPLTDTWAKELLPVGGRPIIDWIVDAIREVDEIDDVHVVTNAPKAPDFLAWARARDVTVHDDGTTSNDDRLGAIGDLQFFLGRTGPDDDLLVIAGDNLFEFSLRDYVGFWRGKAAALGVGSAASAVAVRDVGTLELARKYGIVALDGTDRVVDFLEKPDDPPSTLAATATYLFDRRHLALVDRYLAEGNLHDQPGRFVAWLQEREPVYGWTFDAAWFDVGDLGQLLDADNHVRASRGLALRETYTPDA